MVESKWVKYPEEDADFLSDLSIAIRREKKESKEDDEAEDEAIDMMDTISNQLASFDASKRCLEILNMKVFFIFFSIF